MLIASEFGQSAVLRRFLQPQHGNNAAATAPIMPALGDPWNPVPWAMHAALITGSPALHPVIADGHGKQAVTLTLTLISEAPGRGCGAE
jgi:hypothetical protein